MSNTISVTWQINLSGVPTWTYGNWGGPGWSGGKFTKPGEQPDWSVRGENDLDRIFKTHDRSYWDIQQAWNNSGKTPNDITNYWQSIIAADNQMRQSIHDLGINNGWGQTDPTQPIDINMSDAALQADRAFAMKRLGDLSSLKNNKNPDGIGDPSSGDPFTGQPWPGSSPDDDLSDELSKDFEKGKSVDPIVLDLNGDGVKTTQLSKSFTAGVHFNLDGKGFAENTGWIDKNDGLLVRDLDGNGKITSGRELFGNHTLLTQGANAGKEAANGFEALKELDSNNDGVIDSKDVAFNTLRVWKDGNGNGVTDDGELLTLTQAGIQSLKVAYTNNAQAVADAQGNTAKQTGSYTTTGGSTRDMNDVWFSVDTARTQETDLVAVSDTIAALPDFAHMGNLHSLHQAMARDATGRLKSLVQEWQVGSSTSREAIIDQLIYQWAGVQGLDPKSRGGFIDARQLAVVETVVGEEFVRRSGGVNPSNSTIAQPLIHAYTKFRHRISEELFWQTDAPALIEQLSLKWVSEPTQKLTNMNMSLGHFEWNVDSLAGTLFNQFNKESAVYGIQKIQIICSAFQRHGGGDMLQALQDQSNKYEGLFGSLLSKAKSIGDAEIVQTNSEVVGPMNLMIQSSAILVGASGNDTLIGNSSEDFLIGSTGNDSLMGGVGNDTYIFNKGDGQDTINEYDYTMGNVDTLQLGAGITAAITLVSRVNNDLVLNFGGGDQVTVQNHFNSATYQVEKISFADGTVWGVADIAKQQNGTDSAEAIYGLGGYANKIDGRAGNDTLAGASGEDTLLGGIGNDSLMGGYGNDTYLFNKGDGQDTINEYDYTMGNVDTLQLGAGITAVNTVVSRVNNDLVLNFGGGDQVTVQYCFNSTTYQVEKISFADGTVWGADDLRSPIAGTANADTLAGLNDYKNMIFGDAGNDVLSGGNLSDTLKGGSGADKFLFNKALGANNIDTILDFSSTEGDQIVLDHNVFAKLAGLTNLASNMRLQSQAAVGGDDYVVYNTSTGQLFYDASGNGSSTAQLFATLTNKPQDLTAQQFVVI